MLSILASRLALGHVHTPAPGSPGLWLTGPDRWISDPVISWIISVAASCAIGFLMALVNKVFNLLRTVSVAFVGYFMVMQAATPMALTGFDGGELLALTALVCMSLLYSVYQEPQMTQRIFLLFFLIAGGSVVEYGFALYIPVFLLGCYQMRVLVPRTVIAAIVGLLVPVWILWGFGVIDPACIMIPPMPDPVLIFNRSEAIPQAISVGLTLVAGLYFGSANVIKVIALNARSRAFNGLLSAIGAFTGLLCILDFTNVAFYVTLLNACTAMQAGLYMKLYATRRAYAPVLAVLACYVATFIWHTWSI